jgi:hypothetical protein
MRTAQRARCLTGPPGGAKVQGVAAPLLPGPFPLRQMKALRPCRIQMAQSQTARNTHRQQRIGIWSRNAFYIPFAGGTPALRIAAVPAALNIYRYALGVGIIITIGIKQERFGTSLEQMPPMLLPDRGTTRFYIVPFITSRYLPG